MNKYILKMLFLLNLLDYKIKNLIKFILSLFVLSFIALFLINTNVDKVYRESLSEINSPKNKKYGNLRITNYKIIINRDVFNYNIKKIKIKIKNYNFVYLKNYKIKGMINIGKQKKAFISDKKGNSYYISKGAIFLNYYVVSINKNYILLINKNNLKDYIKNKNKVKKYIIKNE